MRKFTPAFIRRLLYAGSCVGLGHRLERRSQRKAAPQGVPFFSFGDPPPWLPRFRGRGRAARRWPWHTSCTRGFGITARPAPLGQGPRSRSPEGPAPMPRRGSLRTLWTGSRVSRIATFIRGRLGHRSTGIPTPPTPKTAKKDARGPDEARMHSSLKGSRGGPPVSSVG